MLKILAMLMLVLLGTTTIVGSSSSYIASGIYGASINPYTVNETFNGAIMLELLNNILSLIINEDYREAEHLTHVLSNAYVPEKISFIHNKTLTYLRELTVSLESLKKLEDEVRNLLMRRRCDLALEYEGVLRNLTINVFSLKYKLIDDGLLSNYLSSLLNYADLINIRFILKRKIDSNIESLIERLDNYRSEIIDLLDNTRKCNTTNILIVKVINSSREVLGGNPIVVYGMVTTNNGTPIAGVNIALNLIVAGHTISNNTITDKRGYFRGEILTPTSDVLLKTLPMYSKISSINTTLYLFAYKSVNDVFYSGMNKVNITITYIKPRISVECPVAVNYSIPLLLNLTINLNVPLNILIYLDNVELGDFILASGLNTISITVNNTSVGLHTLKFTSIASGTYLPSTYSCTFAIVKQVPALKVSMNNIIVYPFDRLHIYAAASNIGNNSSVNMSVIVDGRTVYTTKGSLLNVTLPPPLTYLIQYHTVSLTVYGENVERTEFSYKILGINPLGLIASLAIVLTGFSVGLDKYVLRLPRIIVGFKRFLSKNKRIIRREERDRGIRRIEKYVYSKISSSIVKIYWLAVRIISKIVGDPSPSETLREYLSRSKKKLKTDLYMLFEKITLLAERDLYSRYKATKEEEEEAKKMLEVMRRR